MITSTQPIHRDILGVRLIEINTLRFNLRSFSINIEFYWIPELIRHIMPFLWHTNYSMQ